MFRGTTPTLSFKVNDIEDLSSVIEDAWITIRNKDKILINKTFLENQVDIDENVISTQLTEQETLSFRPQEEIRIQTKIKFLDEKICASPIFKTTVDNILNPAPMDQGGSI